MKRKLVCASLCGLAGLFCLQSLAAQNFNRFTFDAGGGFTEPVEHTDGRANVGFNITAGAGYNFSPYFGVLGEFGYDRLGLSSTFLNAAGVPDGNGHMYSVTLQPIVHLNPKGRVGAYVTGGGGYYRRTIEYTQPTVGQITIFDPFWGVVYPAAVPATQVLASFVQNKAGLNIGAGVEIRVKGDSNAKIFAEARYHYIYTTPVRTTILPVTFGFRW
jgi:hypothetical protein